MDITDFAVEETGVLHLLNASDEPMLGDDGVQMSVTLYGPGSTQYAAAQTKQSRHLVDVLRRKGKTDLTPEVERKHRAEFLTACTKEFSVNVKLGDLTGTALCEAIYSHPKLGFVAEQVGKFLGEWGNFSKPSTSKSAST